MRPASPVLTNLVAATKFAAALATFMHAQSRSSAVFAATSSSAVDAEARASTVFALPFLAAVATNLRSPANFAPRSNFASLLALLASQNTLPASAQHVLPVSTYLFDDLNTQ